jgi:hypothetical protein
MNRKDFKVVYKEMNRLVKYYQQELNNEKNPDMVNYYTGKLDAYMHTQSMFQIVVAKSCLSHEVFNPDCNCEMCGEINDN